MKALGTGFGRRVSLAIALLAQSLAAAAADSVLAMPGPRLTGSGAATITPGRTVQSGAGFELRAQLTGSDAAIAALPPLQEGGGFALIARASSVSLVCYADTIFRDDFDGDGF